MLATIRWLDGRSPDRLGWSCTVCAVAQGAAAVVAWRKAQAVMPEPRAGVGVELLDVDETVLSRLVGAALAGAEADEVTPPLPAGGWGAERIEWLRSFHRDRRPGLDGPLGEATWAVSSDGEVVGAVRLKRTAEPDVVETGIWLAREGRGKGVGRQAMALVLQKALELGSTTVRADTSSGNVAALFVLQRLGFQMSAEGTRVTALRHLR